MMSNDAVKEEEVRNMFESLDKDNANKTSFDDLKKLSTMKQIAH